MKNIQDIINELQDHPDCIHIEVYTKDHIIGSLIEKYSDELNLWNTDGTTDVVISKDEITELEWEDIGEQIYNYFINGYNNYGCPWIVDEDSGDMEELDIRLKRDVKLKSILR
jgi:hypothetical protein